MKASLKLREDEHKSPLLRAKVPISIFNLPFVTSVTAGDPVDLSIHLLTSFPSFPSLKLSYHPNPNPNPFTLTLKSGVVPFGSPIGSPLQISFQLSPNPNPTFSIQLKPQLGHFSFHKTAVSSSSANPNPNPKENGGGVYHPIPMAATDRRGIEGLVNGGVRVNVRTMMPVGQRAGLKVRWAVRLPEVRRSRVWGSLPYLTVDKISVERLEEEEEEVEGDVKEWSEKDLEAMRGMCFWMGREVEELRKESDSMKESIEAVKMKFLEWQENYQKEGRKYAGNARDAVAGSRGSNVGIAAAGKRA